MKELIIATHNQGKFKEFQQLLAPIQCISQASLAVPGVEETGLSFIENAIIKARHVSRVTGQPVLADDSGLVVEALQGEPGIYSSRFSGEHATDAENIQLLLERLRDVAEAQRVAYFYCALVICCYPDDPMPIIATGQLEGRIIRHATGVGGFGYDPVFYVPVYQRTLAQLTAEEKNRISHRSQALNQLKQCLATMADRA